MSTKDGFAVSRTIVILLCVLITMQVGYVITQHRSHASMCEENLNRIYLAMELYEIERGTLPRLSFFPNDPRNDPDSLCVVLAEYGASRDIPICPAAHEIHRNMGLTYLWNMKLNGAKLDNEGEPRWMLVEINALSDKVPEPHFGRYNILYTDGRILRSSEPPAGLRPN